MPTADPEGRSGATAATLGPLTLPPTKFVAPRSRAEHLPRSRQLAAIDPLARLLLVCAPAGYGKSTLVGQWIAREPERVTAWVQLGTEDDNPFALWIAIVSALAGIDERIGRRSLGALAGPVDDLQGSVLAQLVDDVGASDRPLGLVLDDLHLITDPACHASLAWFVENTPATLRIAVATRSDPALPLGRMRANGEVSELRGEDLRFDAGEVATFLNGHLALGLAASDVAALARRTEGWPAGLYLAALSLRGAADRAGFVAAFAGVDRLIEEYLGPEILGGLDPELRAFLSRTSILERFCAPLCDAVAGVNTPAEALIAELERSNLFLVALDRRRRWYRYHHLFRDLLRAELDATEPERVAELHGRAAVWHHAAGELVDAIGHELAAGNLEAVAAQISEFWAELYNSSHWPTVAAWMAQLPESAVAHVRGYIVLKAWLAGAMGAREEVARLSALAREVDDGRPLPDGSSSTESSLAMIDAIFIYGDVVRARSAALRALELDGGERHTVMLAVVDSYTGFWAGVDEREVRASFGRALVVGGAHESDHAVVSPGYAHLALYDLRAGNVRGARANVEQALRIAEQGGVRERPASCITRTAHGWLLLAEGRPQDADDELRRALELARALREPLHVANALRVLAEVRSALGDDAGAAAYIAEARAIAASCAAPGLLSVFVEASAAAIAGRQEPLAEPLSERERVVLRKLAGNLSLPALARELFVSHNTIKTHCRTIYRKLDVRGRAAAVARARERGLVG
jgi:LuxR family maltose regulon positive regulatory protein